MLSTTTTVDTNVFRLLQMDAAGGPVAGGAAVGVPEPLPRHAPSRLLPARPARKPVEVSLAATVPRDISTRQV